MQKLHSQDFNLWINQNILALEKNELNKVDFKNVIEELRGISNREKRELKTRIMVLMAHILKWIHQPTYRSLEWKRTIKEERRQIRMILDDSPSLKKEIKNYCNLMYEEAVDIAMEETRLSIDAFPKILQLSVNDIIDKTY